MKIIAKNICRFGREYFTARAMHKRGRTSYTVTANTDFAVCFKDVKYIIIQYKDWYRNKTHWGGEISDEDM